MNPNSQPTWSRRAFCQASLAACATPLLSPWTTPSAAFVNQASTPGFQFNYMLGSCMYGYLPLAEILPEVRKAGATAIDIWPRVHGNQREQLDELGEEKFAAMLAQHEITLGCLTQYKLGPLGLEDEMKLARRLGCQTIVTGSVGPRGLQGSELKSAIVEFIEKMKPHLETAAEQDVTIAIENHGNALIESADSLKWLAELRPSPQLAIALAPYHLPQDEDSLSDLILALGDSIEVFYAWQHGHGCTEKLPTDEQLLQLPGRGELNFEPLVAALAKINYRRWTEIFMHPVPRGIPILETAGEVTKEINHSREHLAKFVDAA